MRLASRGVPLLMTAPPAPLVEGLAWYTCTRPADCGTPLLRLGLVNSESWIPILRRTHSSTSTSPVSMAKRGMFPSVRLRGRWVFAAVRTLAWQAWTLTEMTRRHLPSWITTGTAGPTGGLISVNLPSTPVMALTMDACGFEHWSHVAPVVIACTGPLGT